MLRFFYLFMLCALIPNMAEASAWTLSAGQSKNYNSLYFYESSDFFNNEGDDESQNSYKSVHLDNLYEYGYSDRLTLGAEYGYLYQKKESNGSSYGMADLALLARYKVWSDDWSVLSIQPYVKIPLSDDDKTLPRSTGEFDAELRVLYGRGFAGVFKPFFQLEAGYKVRGGNYEDEFSVDATIGASVSDDVEVFLQSFTTVSIEGDTFTYSDFIPHNYHATKLQISAVKKINDKFSLEAGVFRDIYGKNVGKGTGLLFSVWSSF